MLSSLVEYQSANGVKSGESRKRAQVKRREQVLALLTAGLNVSEIGRKLGVSERTIRYDLSFLEEARASVESIIEDEGIDAHDIWIQLSRIFDADRSAILDDEGNARPMREWPLIMRQCLNVVIDDISVRSHDGQTKDKDGGWDKTGKRVRILGIDPQYLKALELAMKHKGVDAMVQPAHQAPASPPVTINIVRVGSEAAQVDGSRQRVIDIPPAE